MFGDENIQLSGEKLRDVFKPIFMETYEWNSCTHACTQRPHTHTHAQKTPHKHQLTEMHTYALTRTQGTHARKHPRIAAHMHVAPIMLRVPIYHLRTSNVFDEAHAYQAI